MPRVNIREKDPVHYAKVKAEQEELSKQCSSKMTMARICPYQIGRHRRIDKESFEQWRSNNPRYRMQKEGRDHIESE